MIYIYDLIEGLSSNAKLFVDDTSSFFVIHDIQTSANNLKKDLEKINKWATQLKMNFNSDITKQAQEVIFSGKLKKRFILHYCLMMPLLLGYLPKNAWELYLTIS